MSGAAAAVESLQDTLAREHAYLVAAVAGYSALRKPWETTEIIEAMQDSARLHLVAMDIVTAAKAVASAARDALQLAFEETGCPAVDITGYRVSAQDGSRVVRIMDASKIPHNYTTQPPTPPREPDMKLIRTLLVAGDDVPGAELSRSSPSIRFTKRST